MLDFIRQTYVIRTITVCTFLYATYLFFAPIDPSSEGLFPHFDKFAHFVVFGALTTLGCFSYSRQLTDKTKTHLKFNLTMVIVFFAIYGASIECLQGSFFDREASMADWLADMLGTLTSLFLLFKTRLACLLFWVAAR
ncbi:VanZ family protein [Catenovulum sp. SX2]|uniref:VanZ family protein n=1 Tax=Catenovulum TaxID=1172191 RepID=UPI0003165F59|nr:VanZ family protein [Catenovulum agarivorans]